MRGNSFVLMGLGVVALAANGYSAVYSVASPDGKIQAGIEDGTRLTLTLTL